MKEEKNQMGKHPSHETRFSDASTFDEICVNCGATDEVPGGWGLLANPCNSPKATIVPDDAELENQNEED